MRERLTKRFLSYGIAMAALFLILIVGLANLQIRADENYGELAEKKKTKIITTRGDRGIITDANSNILAQDIPVYNVCFYRDPTWKPGQDEDGNSISAYGKYTESILQAIEIVERYGGEIIGTFALQPQEDTWAFEWGNISEEAKVAREKMWRENLYVVNVDINEIITKLTERYKIPQTLSLEKKMQVLAVWQEMQMNAFLTSPIVIARNVSWSTVLETETYSMSLHGISIVVATRRVYPQGTHMAHLVGYIGKIQRENLETYNTQLKEKGYKLDDLIGIAGVEKSMEEWLTPNTSQRQGTRLVEVDRYGSVSRELENTPPQNGNNVKLTIDSNLQRIAESGLEATINEIRTKQESQYGSSKWQEENKQDLQGSERDFEKNPIKFAEKGAIIVVDMVGHVKALASYPPYDPNAFIVGGETLQAIVTDPRNPLVNYGIQSLATPGSIFKMVTASAGLAYGVITPETRIDDLGPFTKYDTSNPPRCWIPANRVGSIHLNQTVVEGMANSCNYFFYTVASELGSEKLYRYAALYGLTTKTFIELPGELQSYVGNQQMLYDPTKAISAAEQATWRPTLVAGAIKKHLQRIGKERNIIFDEDNLDRAIKRLMDMAVETDQGPNWIRSIRAILMEELDMSRELVYLQVVVGDIYIMLNEVKWGGNETIMTGIGQSITQVTPAAIARYVAAVANGGTVYDLTIIDSITTPEGEVISKREPVIASEMPELEPYLPYIRKGMLGVVDDGGTAAAYFDGFEFKNQMAAKTGTAQVSKIDLENNAWFVAFAPYENPEIAVVCYVPNGYGGGRAYRGVRDIIDYYMRHRSGESSDLMPAANALSY